MYDRAMDKLRDEMAETKNEAISAVGEMMTMILQERPDMAERILQEGKTIDGAYNAMYELAKKEQKGGCFCIEPLRAIRIAMEYYGKTITDAEAFDIIMGGTRAKEPGKKQATEENSLDLDALLED